jgi:hypothetical protein
VEGVNPAMIEGEIVGEGFHLAFVKQVYAAAEKIFPMFDIGPNGERVTSINVLAALLGESVEDLKPRAVVPGVAKGTRHVTVRITIDAAERASKPTTGKTTPRKGGEKGEKEGDGDGAPTHGLPPYVWLTKDGHPVGGQDMQPWPNGFDDQDRGTAQDLGTGGLLYKIDYDNASHIRYRLSARGDVARDVVTEKYILGANPDVVLRTRTSRHDRRNERRRAGSRFHRAGAGGKSPQDCRWLGSHRRPGG